MIIPEHRPGRLVLCESPDGPPDVRITAADRQLVRQLVARCERRLSDEALMHLAGGIEAAAWRKRASRRASA